MVTKIDTKKGEGYWDARKQSLYLYCVRELIKELGKDAESVIDIGSGKCPYINWFDWIAHRTSLDISSPYTGEGITSVRADFLKWEPDRRYDIATCLQVLEHVPDVETFARKLLAVADIVVVSVPFNWKPGANVSHVHDPVNNEKMQTWFGREPNFKYRVVEISSGSPRLIHVYENSMTDKWSCVAERRRLIARSMEMMGGEW